MGTSINGGWKDSWKEHPFTAQLKRLNYTHVRRGVILSLEQKCHLTLMLKQIFPLIRSCIFFLIKSFEVQFLKVGSHLIYRIFLILCFGDRI